ncbi:MAG: 50S ribosomal protein L18, partial [Bacteroidota bacterium]
MNTKKVLRRTSIRKRIRKTIKGTPEFPRLSVFRSNKQIYAQIIDDVAGITMAAASSRQLKDVKAKKSE